MATQNRYAFLLNKRGKLNTSDIYAQLQAPAQRAAYQSTLSDYASVGPYVQTDPITGESHLVNQIAPSYDDAKRAANIAVYMKTIDPSQLAKGIDAPFSQSNIKNAYINPVAEGAYDYSPSFDWMGRQVAGIGAKTPKQTKIDAMMYDLKHGDQAQRKNYLDAIAGAVSNAKAALAAYQATAARAAYENQRLPNLDTDAAYRAWRQSGSTAYQDYLDAQTMQGNRYGVSFIPGGGTGPDSFYQINLQNARHAAVARHGMQPLSFLRHQGLSGLGPPVSSYSHYSQ